MSYLELATGTMIRCPAGVLNRPGVLHRGWQQEGRVAIMPVHVDPFELQEQEVTVDQWMAFLERHADRPYGRFVQEAGDYLRLVLMGPFEEAAKGCPDFLPDKPPFHLVVKVVPTREEYEARFVADDRELFLRDGRQPAVNVTGYEAMAYAASLGGRLPTRWEYQWAALAGRQGAHICGVGGNGTLTPGNAHWSSPGSPKGAPAPVGHYPPTPWGHHDLAGNVYEWVTMPAGNGCGLSSLRAEDARARGIILPKRGGDGFVRLPAAPQVIAGGSWANTEGTGLEADIPHEQDPHCRGIIIGFRVARGQEGLTFVGGIELGAPPP